MILTRDGTHWFSNNPISTPQSTYSLAVWRSCPKVLAHRVCHCQDGNILYNLQKRFFRCPDEKYSGDDGTVASPIHGKEEHQRDNLHSKKDTDVVRVAEPDVASVPAWKVVRYCELLRPSCSTKYCRGTISRLSL